MEKLIQKVLRLRSGNRLIFLSRIVIPIVGTADITTMKAIVTATRNAISAMRPANIGMINSFYCRFLRNMNNGIISFTARPININPKRLLPFRVKLIKPALTPSKGIKKEKHT
jgi:hypothetical protein